MNAEEFLEFEKKRRLYEPTLNKLSELEGKVEFAGSELKLAQAFYDEMLAKYERVLWSFYEEYDKNEGIEEQLPEIDESGLDDDVQAQIDGNLEEGLEPEAVEVKNGPFNYSKHGSLSVNDLVDGERSLVRSAQEGLTF